MIKYLSIFILVFTLAFVGFQNDVMASRRDNHRNYHNYHHTNWDDDEEEDCEEEDDDDPATPTPTVQPIVTPTPTASPIVTPTPVITATATASPAPTQNPDVCPNIDGVQLNLPDEYHHDNAGVNCLKFELGGPSQFTALGGPNPSNAIGGANVTSVAKSGQVLGASTMASTGATEDAIFNTIFTFGSLLTSFGIMKNGKKAVKS